MPSKPTKSSKPDSVRLRTLTTAALLALALLVAPGAAATGASADPGDRARSDQAAGTDAERAADQALAEARALVDPDAPRPDRDATMVLRDLVLRLDDLGPRERAVADRILARPEDGGDFLFGGYTVAEEAPDCTGNVCLHWVSSTVDATTPEWKTQTSAVLAEVWTKLVDGLGYRVPQADDAVPSHGPDGKLDVYLADLGGLGIYGYCIPEPQSDTAFYASGYCVLDNDFAATQYGGAEPLTSLRVTAAHEFFHALQFAYDYAEDLWLMEGSAAWVEEQVYDDANDNYQYLDISALELPMVPLDLATDTHRPYGAWLFWQFLTESVSAGGDDPAIIREIWELADSTPGHDDQYSAQATRNALAARGIAFAEAFRVFGVANRVPGRAYSEGAAFPAAPLTKTFTLTKSRPGTGSWSTRLDHLTTDYLRFKPGTTLTGSRKLKVSLDMQNRSRGSAATLMVYRKGGGLTLKKVALSSTGAATVSVPFSRSEVTAVDLVLTNASIRYDNCWSGYGESWQVSCAGYPRDDNQRTIFAAKAVKG